MEQLGEQEDLAVGDGDDVGGDVGGYVARLGFDDGQCRDGTAAMRGVQPCGALQKAAVQVEHIAGIGFASRRTADEQRQGAVGDRVLAQVVVDDQHVLALIHEVFGHGAAGIGRDVLQGRKLGRGGADHDGIVHRAGGRQGVHQLRHGGTFLSDGHIDADDVLALLIDDGIQSDDGLTGLTVADDEFALAAADGNHAVDGLDTGLQRHAHALAFDDAGRVVLDGPVFLCVHGALAVHGLAQGVDHTADQAFANGNGNHMARALDHIAFFDVLVVAQHDHGDAVFLQIQGHAVGAVGKLHQLVGHALIQTAHTRDAVADHDRGADIILCDAVFIMLDLLFDELGDLFGF